MLILFCEKETNFCVHLKQLYIGYAVEQSGTCEAPVNTTKYDQKEDRSKCLFRKKIEANVHCFHPKKPKANVHCFHQKKPEANVNCFH